MASEAADPWSGSLTLGGPQREGDCASGDRTACRRTPRSRRDVPQGLGCGDDPSNPPHPRQELACPQDHPRAHREHDLRLDLPPLPEQGREEARTEDEPLEVLCWLTGFTRDEIHQHIEEETTFEGLFEAATLHPNASLITGVICGYRVEEIEDSLTQQARYMDKLVDEPRAARRWRRSCAPERAPAGAPRRSGTAEKKEPRRRDALLVAELRADYSSSALPAHGRHPLQPNGRNHEQEEAEEEEHLDVGWTPFHETSVVEARVDPERQRVLSSRRRAEVEDSLPATLVRERRKQVRDEIAQRLSTMDPFAFEGLVKTLLEAMDYEDVEVTSKSGDGEVDVIGRIQLGITEVVEVVQVKRHARNIQRSVMDALRGSLHRFGAVRGTIITTGGFARGTKEAAFEPGAPPITLIDGDRLIDLMLDHDIGVSKRRVELLEVEPSAFATPTEEPGE